MVESQLVVTYTSEAGARYDDGETQVDAAGSYFANDGKVILVVNNADAGKSPILTVTGQNACSFGVSHNRTYTCTFGQKHVIGPFSKAHFNDATGKCHIAWSETAAAIKVKAIALGSTLG